MGALKPEWRPERLLRSLMASSARDIFSVRLTRESVKTLKLLAQMSKRMRAVERMTPYLAANVATMEVAARIPKNPEWAGYQKTIKLVRAGSEKAEFPTFVTYAKPRALSNRDIDGSRSVLYIRPKKTFLGRVPKEVLTLARYSPWTSEMLPFSPKKNEAVTVVRKVTKREVQRITQRLKQDEPKWRKELNDAGIRQTHKTSKPPELKTKIVSDLAFDGLRLEFGYGGTKPIPHWRPAIKVAVSYVKRLYTQRSFLSKAMTDLTYQAWRKWPPKVESSIRLDLLKTFTKFSKRLHVRV